ncbi:L-aspartate oxidase [Rhizosaccharibacter radicis]|uniref:L-aspartate oxidase n=1 Tax=Rhizosaccharibacter radicis TaxID=2782605 RepID=A0ABT1VXD8_9PROT|nr:L-aspartate oxidase [Acetobacteraceae bacterium KSS12]
MILQARADRPLIVGAGLAGLMTALELLPMPCLLVSHAALGAEASSGWAQGGLAAAVGADDDPARHLADTLAAGDGLCDPAIARSITAQGPALVERLLALGVRFDRRSDGALALGLEAAHGRHRIVHARGDATGAEIVRALVEAVRAAPAITVIEGLSLRSIGTGDGRVAGAWFDDRRPGHAGAVWLPATRVVLATGGIGGLFRDTTNPPGAVGRGLAAAARAGARLGDMEFVQFHPTALAVDAAAAGPLPLVSEAVRGEGAVLVDERGERFTDELQPRDVVSRAVWRHLSEGHGVFLDAREALGERFAARFPGIDAACRARGVVPSLQPIPVRPAAHYHMGGIAVDADGRSTLPGLWAAGEVACTGLHGANRLASNSLLEAAVGGMAVARAIGGEDTPVTAAGAPTETAPGSASGRQQDVRQAAPEAVREALSRGAGVLRDGDGLERAVALLRPLAAANDAALVGLMLCLGALERRESRGGHHRTDHPERDPVAVRRTLSATEALSDGGAPRVGGQDRGDEPAPFRVLMPVS